MSDQVPRETQPVPYEMVLETLDREGDVILTAGDDSTSQRRFLVSSKVLSLASPVFAALFGPQFLEGSLMAEHGPITIHLNEDDAKAMGITLQILHHQTPPEIKNLTTQEMAILAIVSDKYDCVRVIQPWTSTWFLRHETVSSPNDYGLLLTAAHFLRASDEFTKISREATLILTKTSIDTWEDTDIVNILPENVRWALSNEIGILRYDIHKEVQYIEVELRDTQNRYPIKGTVCGDCGIPCSYSKHGCPFCWMSVLYPRMCTVEYRISEYFEVLRMVGLWPSLDPFEDCSASNLALRIGRARGELRKNHLCDAKPRCDLIICVERLSKKIDKILKNSMGVPLYPVSG